MKHRRLGLMFRYSISDVVVLVVYALGSNTILSSLFISNSSVCLQTNSLMKVLLRTGVIQLLSPHNITNVPSSMHLPYVLCPNTRSQPRSKRSPPLKAIPDLLRILIIIPPNLLIEHPIPLIDIGDITLVFVGSFAREFLLFGDAVRTLASGSELWRGGRGWGRTLD